MIGTIIIPLAIVAVVGISGFQMLLGPRDSNEISSNTFKTELLKNRKVENLTCSGQSGAYFMDCAGTIVGSEETFSVILPYALTENDEKYIQGELEYYSPGLSFFDVFLNFAPWLMIIGFWLFLMRRMQGGAGGQNGIFNFAATEPGTLPPL